MRLLDATDPVTVTVIDTDAALLALAPEWDALWHAAPGRSPFQHPAWLLSWWSAFGSGQPLVATARRGQRLVGIIPAYLSHEAGARKALPIGAGTTDYLDAIGDGIPAMTAALLARCAARGVLGLDWFDAPPGAAIVAAVPAVWVEGNACPVLTLAEIPASIRRKQRMNQNRAARAGGWTVNDAGPDGLDALVALHRSRWAAADQPGVLDDPAVLCCLRTALPRLHAAGLLRLHLLHIADRPAAAILAMVAPGRIEFYLSGYDAAQSFVSPGTILLGAMLDQAIAEGRIEAHFLRGQEPYKYAWGARDRLNRAAIMQVKMQVIA